MTAFAGRPFDGRPFDDRLQLEAPTSLLRLPGLLSGVVAAWLLTAINAASRMATWHAIGGGTVDVVRVGAWVAVQTITWSLLTVGLFRVVDRWKKRRPIVSLPRTTALVLAATFAAIFLDALSFRVSGLSDESPFDCFVRLVPLDFHATMIWIVIVIAVGRGVRDRRDAEARSLRSARAETELLRARLESVGARLQPHFVFNVLNSIATLIHRDVSAAEKAISEFAALLRTAMAHHPEGFAPFEQELAFVRHYIELYRLRFGDRLLVTLDVDTATLRVPVPRLILQPFVENALKHGVHVDDGVCRVEVRASVVNGRLLIIVKNDIPRDAPWNRAGIGSTAVRERLDLLFPDDYELSWLHDESSVTVRLLLPVGSPSAID